MLIFSPGDIGLVTGAANGPGHRGGGYRSGRRRLLLARVGASRGAGLAQRRRDLVEVALDGRPGVVLEPVAVASDPGGGAQLAVDRRHDALEVACLGVEERRELANFVGVLAQVLSHVTYLSWLPRPGRCPYGEIVISKL